MNNLVSIIVPVYNVAEYLVECIDSIIVQDYTNLEIILVNDGSTDGSEIICENYLNKDNRIQVIHQENSGLSAARNTGITNIKGKYVVFVDSDDILHPSYVSTMLNILTEKDRKLVMCDMLRFQEKNKITKIQLSLNKEVITSKQTIKRFLRGEWWSAWAKMYKSELFDNIRFPIGRNNEDYAILTQIFEQCPEVVYLRAPLYFYRIRQGSITKSTLNEHSFDEIDNSIEVLEYVAKKHPEFYAEAEANLAYSLAKLYLALQANYAPQYAHRLQQILALYYVHGSSFLKNSIITVKSRFFIWFHVKLPFLAPYIIKLYILYKNIV